MRDGVSMKRVLVIAYGFPPAGYVGVHRVFKFCKYLHASGWEPIVITIKADAVQFTDPHLGAELPAGIKIHRTRDWDPLKWLLRRKRATAAPEMDQGPRMDRSAPRPTIGPRIKRALLQVLTASPDSHLFWVPFAVARGVRVLLKEKVEAIFCSSPPHSSHLAAWILSKCFRIPYISDFRDVWILEGASEATAGKMAMAVRWETFLRRLIVRGASRLIAVSPGERMDLVEQYPEVGVHGRCVVITNGYDADDFAHIKSKPGRTAKFVLTHAGTVYTGTAEEFLRAVYSLVTTDPSMKERLEVRFVGAVDEEYQDMVMRMGLGAVVTLHGLLPHRSALQWATDSDVLLILAGGDRFRASHVPAKVFEYLHCGKPILAVTRKGDLSDILDRSGLGVVVPPHDGEALVGKIRELAQAKERGMPVARPNLEYIRRFERRAQAEQLVCVLEEAVREKRPR